MSIGNIRLNRTKCCICKKYFSGLGNNPYPIKKRVDVAMNVI